MKSLAHWAPTRPRLAISVVAIFGRASSGQAEAHELRDGDASRYGGLGCRTAVNNVNGVIASAIVGKTLDSQAALDEVLLQLDGSSNKSNLGANALLAVSLAFSKAVAEAKDQPLFQYYADQLGQTQLQLPRPTINLFSGGLHAGGQVPIQDVLVVPASAQSVDEALAMTYRVFQAAAALAQDRYGYP